MKFCFALISLLLCCSLALAQRNCPSICPAVYSPVCGQARVGGQLVSCTFSNSCSMGANGCNKNINWRQVSPGACRSDSPRCGGLL